MQRFLLLLTLVVMGCTAAPPPSQTPPLTFIGTAALPPKFDAQGHRGARGLQPENTLPAFETALDLGVTTLELDLHFTQDGSVIIWHDPIIDADKCRLDPAATATDPANPLRRIRIRDHTLSTLKAYLCDQNPDEDRFPDQRPVPTQLAGSDYHLITLAELFEFVGNYANSVEKTAAQRENATTVHFNIETKRNPSQPQNIGDDFDGVSAGPFELAILETIAHYGLGKRVTIQSFDHRSLTAVRAINQEITLAALTTGGSPNPEIYAAKGFNIWSPNANDLTADLLAEAHRFGLHVIPWTVNDQPDMQRLIKMGVDGLITDRPDLLLTLP